MMIEPTHDYEAWLCFVPIHAHWLRHILRGRIGHVLVVVGLHDLPCSVVLETGADVRCLLPMMTPPHLVASHLIEQRTGWAYRIAGATQPVRLAFWARYMPRCVRDAVLTVGVSTGRSVGAWWTVTPGLLRWWLDRHPEHVATGLWEKGA